MENQVKAEDLFGLSAPLTKLIEVVSRGIGNFIEPYHIKKRAEAKAYEIKVISESIEEHASTDITKYANGNINLENLIGNNIEERTLDRMIFQQTKKQENIEKIIYVAKQDLELKESVSDEKVDQDWITRFFNVSQDISNEQMQILWGQILSGEIEKPNTYSIRTLETLKNITAKEAETFTKIAKLAIRLPDSSLIIRDENYLKQNFNIKYEDILLMQELNLINSNETIRYGFPISDNNQLTKFIYGYKIIFLERKKGAPIQNINVYKLTKAGNELLNLVKTEFNEDYIKYLFKDFKHENVSLYYSTLLSENGDEVTYKQDFTEI